MPDMPAHWTARGLSHAAPRRQSRTSDCGARLLLTRDEATRLHEVLEYMVSDESDPNDQWHAHVSADDGAAEIIVRWDPSASA
jgi:hypothetical protein